MRILIVEDEKHLKDIIHTNLELEGFEVLSVMDGKSAMAHLKSEHFDLIILDIMLPDISGLDICEQIRLENAEVPIIFVSAKDTSEDRILGLKRGADDYLVKPFNLEELLLRVQKLLKRSQQSSGFIDDIYSFGENWINLKTFEAKGSSGKFNMTKKEIKLMKLFIERKEEVISRKQILQVVWGYDVFPSTRTIDNFILSLRKYFEVNPKEPKFFHSIRGVGYKFTPVY